MTAFKVTSTGREGDGFTTGGLVGDWGDAVEHTAGGGGGVNTEYQHCGPIGRSRIVGRRRKMKTTLGISTSGRR